METKFNCPRTCPYFEQRDTCRFQPVFSRLGSWEVTSHTVTVKVKFSDPGALGRAAVALGGQVLGQGSHNLFSTTETGFGITLPNWRFPLVAKANGEIAFDDFGGRWGNKADLEKLKARYALECARLAAESQGWLAQEEADGLRIYHPSGGTLLVDKTGKTEAFGFEGVGCHEASMLIANAVGKPEEVTVKPEYFVERAKIRVAE